MRVNFELKQELYVRFREEVHARGRSMSDVIRQLINEFLVRCAEERAKMEADNA